MEKTFKNYLILFFTMLKIGLFTFGGGYAMIALLQREFVKEKKWIDEEELIEMITVSESTPGPIAINMATYIGYKILKTLGAVVATLGVVIPSFVIIVVISIFLDQFMAIEVVQHAFIGINCAVGFLIFYAGISLIKSMKKDWLSYLLFAFTFFGTLAVLFFGINVSTVIFIVIGIVVSLVVNLIHNKIKPQEQEEDKSC